MINENKQKALATALAQIDKDFGKGTIMKLGDSTGLEISSISTGSLKLDKILGVGGLPKGRIIEIYGPESGGKTTMALHAIAECQKQGGNAVFIDAEHALDPTYARAIGVDIDNLYICQPTTGEQALEVADKMIQSCAVDICVIDSVAALVPRAELEGDMGDSHVGLQARLMSQALRKLTASVNKSGCILIFINQIREKVGVMFGCLHADTKIPFTNGESYSIKEIVENEIKGKVWSYNEDTNTFEEKEIIDWFYNGDVESSEDYIHIETNATGSMGGAYGITVTPNHQIFTDNGWKEAKEIKINDRILSKYKSIINDTLSDFLYGTFIGDTGIRIRTKNTACIVIQDNLDPEYALWKKEKLDAFFTFKEVYKKETKYVKYVSDYSGELAIIKKEIGRREPAVMLDKHYSDMGLALWFMDDGYCDLRDSHKRASISVKRFKNRKKELIKICKAFSNRGLKCTYRLSDGTIVFDKENSIKLFKRIAKYVPKCMERKLPPEFRGKYEDFTLNTKESEKNTFVCVHNVRNASDKQMRQKGKYDLCIEGNHNYLAGGIHGGVLVHNSPETTAGGRALKFYSSVRMDVRRTETVKSSGEAVSNKVKIKIVKNKVAPPFKETIVDIVFGQGIDKNAEILDIAVEKGLIIKSGAWFSLPNGEKIGQGAENAKKYINEHKELREQLLKDITVENNTENE